MQQGGTRRIFRYAEVTAPMLILVTLLVSPATTTGQAILGERAPDFTLHDVDGREFSSRKLRGNVVVLDFWAVWCAPCQLSLPFYQGLAEKYADRGLQVVGLHVDDRMPLPNEIKGYLDRRGVGYTNLVSTREVDDAFRIEAMPTTFILDRDGRIRDHHVGFDPRTTPDRIEEYVQELLDKN